MNGTWPRLAEEFRIAVGNQSACYPAPGLPVHQRSLLPCPVGPCELPIRWVHDRRPLHRRPLRPLQKHRRGRGLEGPARGWACVMFFLFTGSSVPGPFVARPERSSQSILKNRPHPRSAGGRVTAVPPQLPQPPRPEGRSHPSHEHHLRGLGDDGDDNVVDRHRIPSRNNRIGGN